MVREAQNSAVRGRTWWSVDQCLRELARRQVVPTELRLLPRGPAPPDFPSLPVETAPTESARRKPASPTVAAKVQPGSPSRVSWLDDPDDGEVETGGVNKASSVGGVSSKDEDWELKDDDEEEGGGGGSKTV